MIYLISDREYPLVENYQQITFDQFLPWGQAQTAYQLDIETNVVEDLTERELFVVQIGSVIMDHQFVFDYAGMSPLNQKRLVEFMDDKSKQKVIHNATFEYTVLKWTTGIEIGNIYDTYLALKVLLNGKHMPKDIYQLKGAVKEFLGVELSKDEQTTFDGNTMSLAQIHYAALDVYYMVPLLQKLKEFEDYADLESNIQLQNEAVRGFGDILFNGFNFSVDKWEENLAWAIPQVEAAKKEIYSIIRGPELLTTCMNRGFIRVEEEVNLNWKSSKQKSALLSRIYPDMEKFTKPHIKVKEKTLPDGNLLGFLMENDFDGATKFVLEHHKDIMEDLSIILPAGEITVNLNSPAQRLKLFQTVEPHIEDTKADTLEKCKHPMIKAYSTYIKRQKMVQSYGTNFYEFVGKDGKIRPRYVDMVLATGRVAISKPGLMTIPADEGYYVGDRYREAFVAEEGWSIIASDYKSQELAVIAYLSGEESWLDAIKTGKDLHSMNSFRVFGDKWIKAGGDDKGTKPTTEEGKKLRSYSKAISFGLAYGLGPGGLAKRLDISRQEAVSMINQFFGAFPKIKQFLDSKAAQGMAKGYIDIGTGNFNGRRYFGDWNTYYVPEDVSAGIERQSKNTAIQGGSAIATKVSMVLIKNYIETHSLQDKVRIIFMLHDAVVCEARDEYAEEWAVIMTRLMEEGHNYLTPGNLVGADTAITKTWTK